MRQQLWLHRNSWPTRMQTRLEGSLVRGASPFADSHIRDWDWAEARPGDFEALWLWHHFTILGPIMASGPLPSFPHPYWDPWGVSGWALLTFLTPGPGAAQVTAAVVASAVGPVYTGSVGPTGLWGTHRPRTLRV